MQSELMRWRLKWTSTEEGDRPTFLAKAIKSCNSDGYPNIYTLLKIAYTLPVTSCECERSISVLRQLDSFIRHSMPEERLSALALIHIHYNHHVDLNEAVDIFSKVHPRHLELDCIIIKRSRFSGLGPPPLYKKLATALYSTTNPYMWSTLGPKLPWKTTET